MSLELELVSLAGDAALFIIQTALLGHQRLRIAAEVIDFISLLECESSCLSVIEAGIFSLQTCSFTAAFDSVSMVTI
jgi:hypothetical protein